MLNTHTFQSVDQIIEVTGGNKTMIRNLAQTGQAPLEICLLAGMKVDRIRDAAQAEQQPQQTVVERVLGTAPPAPPQSAPAGLGATPEAAQMGPMTLPQGGAPMPPQPPEQMQPMGPGMADGGIASLPVPDDMFNSSVGDNQQYADGGMIAFAPGGLASAQGIFNNLDQAYAKILRLEGGLGPRGEMLTSPAGAIGPAQLLPSTARDAAPMAGLPWDDNKYRTDPAYNTALGKAYYASRVDARGGDFAKAALDYHTGMGNVDRGNIGPQGRNYLSNFTGGASAPAPARGAPAPAPASASAARASASAPPAAPAETLASSFRQLSDLLGVRITKAQDAKLAAQTGTLEEEKKSKDRDFGYALIEASEAFGEAGPFGSQLGKGFANMAKSLREGQKTREAKKLGALTAAAEAERQEYADRAAMLAPAANLYQAEATNRLADRRLAAEADQFGLQEERIVEEGRLNRVSDEVLARIQANPSDQEGAIAAIQAEFPNKSRAFALERYLKLLQMYAPAALAVDPFLAAQARKDAADAAAAAAAATAGTATGKAQIVVPWKPQ